MPIFDVYIPRKSVFYISRGEYSQYHVLAHFRARKHITKQDLEGVEQRCRERVEANREKHLKGVQSAHHADALQKAVRDAFIPELVASGYAEEILCDGLTLGHTESLSVRMIEPDAFSACR